MSVYRQEAERLRFLREAIEVTEDEAEEKRWKRKLAILIRRGMLKPRWER